MDRGLLSQEQKLISAAFAITSAGAGIRIGASNVPSIIPAITASCVAYGSAFGPITRRGPTLKRLNSAGECKHSNRGNKRTNSFLHERSPN